MSYSEKPDDITREEWMDKLNNVHIQRADMNRLIMNYLVTGIVTIYFYISSLYFIKKNMFLKSKALTKYALLNRGLQGGSREIQDGVWN